MKVRDFKHTCSEESAPTFRTWIRERGGVAVWNSLSLSTPGKSWSTPAKTKTGEDTPRPTWDADYKPALTVTEEKDIGVCTDKEVRRFRVATRHGRSNPLLIKCTDASSRKIHAAVEKAGEGAYHVFDYESREAVIMQPVGIVPLSEWSDGASTS
jgi:hypothetical protein